MKTKGGYFPLQELKKGYLSTLKAWGVIVDGSFLIGAAPTQEEARFIRDAWILKANKNHQMFDRCEVAFINAKVKEHQGEAYYSRKNDSCGVITYG